MPGFISLNLAHALGYPLALALMVEERRSVDSSIGLKFECDVPN